MGIDFLPVSALDCRDSVQPSPWGPSSSATWAIVTTNTTERRMIKQRVGGGSLSTDGHPGRAAMQHHATSSNTRRISCLSNSTEIYTVSSSFPSSPIHPIVPCRNRRRKLAQLAHQLPLSCTPDFTWCWWGRGMDRRNISSDCLSRSSIIKGLLRDKR